MNKFLCIVEWIIATICLFIGIYLLLTATADDAVGWLALGSANVAMARIDELGLTTNEK